jgi:hypothetical protein
MPALTPDAREPSRSPRADVVLFFGGSILSGADVMAAAIRSGIAATTMLVGGEGHTTQALRDQAAQMIPGDTAPGRSEADIFQHYLHARHGVTADLLERESTNCGDNITRALAVLNENAIPHSNVILIQDATMQRRIGAGWNLAQPDAHVVNFASYTVQVVAHGDSIRYHTAPGDMWPIPRFTSMLMGEITRLRDDKTGYGPRGRGWIAHVDIPPVVEEAYELLSSATGYSARIADPHWASTR